MKRTKKEVYIDKMAKQLKEWSAGIDELERKLTGATTDLKAGLDIRIDELKFKREELAGKLQALKESGGSAWETLKGGVETALHDFTRALDEARKKFRKAA